MRIVSLDPALTETICYLGLEENLVGISHRCNFPDTISNLPRVTGPRSGDDGTLRCSLSDDLVDIQALTSLKPDIILTKIEEAPDSNANLQRARALLSQHAGAEVRLNSYSPK